MKDLSMFTCTSRLSREDRINQFYAILEASDEALTALQLSRIAGLKKTPWSVGILNEMVDAGLLDVGEILTYNGLWAQTYTIAF